MACRVGMTTNLEERRKYWKGRHPNLRNWEKLGTYRSKSEAQKKEKEFAQKHECEQHGGGGGLESATWYVYKFDY